MAVCTHTRPGPDPDGSAIKAVHKSHTQALRALHTITGTHAGIEAYPGNDLQDEQS